MKGGIPGHSEFIGTSAGWIDVCPWNCCLTDGNPVTLIERRCRAAIVWIALTPKCISSFAHDYYLLHPGRTTVEKTPMVYLKSVLGVLLILCFSRLAHAQDQRAGANSSQQGPVASPSKTPATTSDDNWHVDLMFYLWLAGMNMSIFGRALRIS